MTIDVRPAVPADAHGIAVVHVRSWSEAYAHLVPPEALARQRVEQRELRWTEMLVAATSGIWVALDGDAIIGFASSEPARGEHPPRDLELATIYVLASHHGTGAGQALLDAAIADRPALLWVAENNPRARAFYRRNGFEPDGADEMHAIAGTPVKAIRLIR